MFNKKKKELQNKTVGDLRSYLEKFKDSDKVCISTIKNGWTNIHCTHGLLIQNEKEQTGWFGLLKY